MGARGPQGVPQETLLSSAMEVRDLFKNLTRQRFDQRLYGRRRDRILSSPFSPLTAREAAALERRIDELHVANLTPKERDERILMAEDQAKADANLRKLDRQIRRSKRQAVPDGEQILNELFSAATKKRLIEICKRRLPPSWIGEVNPTTLLVVKRVKVYNPLGKLLIANAGKFIAAKTDSRFPGSSRASSYDKRIWFIARVLAGAIHGLTIRTAIDRIPARWK